MLKKIYSNRGETLIEILIALVILILGSAGALRIISASIANNQISKERVIATNLAREGVELVRNVRDTNWLRFAGERRECWNTFDYNCGGSSISSGYYKIDFSIGDRADLMSVSAGINLEDGLNGQDASYRLYEDSSTGLISHDSTKDPTIYFREIRLDYLDQNGSLSNNQSENSLRVNSRVTWVDRGEVYNVVLTTVLTDYLGRTPYQQ